MAKLINFFKNMIGPKIIINTLKKQDGVALGYEVGKDIIDKALDAEFGNKKSEQIQNVIIPFGEAFWRGIKKGLLEDRK